MKAAAVMSIQPAEDIRLDPRRIRIWWRRFNLSEILETAFAIIIILTVIRALEFTFSAGYLPRPFFYNVDDDLMDWFNTAIYSFNSGGYSHWKSIYPPFSFLFLRLFSSSRCYVETDAIFARSCDVYSHVSIFAFYVLDLWLVYRAYKKSDPRTAIQRTIAMGMGLPLLFALDRGNLIVPCFTCFVVGYSRIIRSARVKWLAVALAVNFKPYLAVSVVPALLKRRWRWVEGCAVMSVIVFAISYAIYGSGSPMEIITNIVGYAVKKNDALFDASYYASSYNSIIMFMKSQFPLMHFIGSRYLEELLFWLPVISRVGQGSMILALLLASLKPMYVPWYRISAFGVALILGNEGAGGYAQVFFLFLVFFERWSGWAISVALVCAYLLSWPADVEIYKIAHQVANSYWTNRTVGMDFGISLGEILRPGVLALLEVALFAATSIGIFQGMLRERAGVVEHQRTS